MTAGETNTKPTLGPLAGVRVLDLSSVIMGPYATQILGDMGADVICIEDRKGDTNRVMGPGPEAGMSGVSLNLLRNKRNVCLDLKHPDGRAAALRIAATCDVVVTNLRPGPLSRLGLTYGDLVGVRPDIVMCQAQGWPSDGPDAELPAYDDVIQAVAGIADTFQHQTGRPALIPTIVADKVSGMTIVHAVLAALFHRERTGQGQFVEVPMVEAVIAFTLVEHGSAAVTEPPLGPAGYSRVLAKGRRPLRTLDGWMAVLPYSEPNYRDLFATAGRSHLADHRIVTAQSRLDHVEELYADLVDIIAAGTTEFWVSFCRAHDIPAGAVRTLDELTAELPIVEHPHVGRYHLTPSPTRFSETPTSLRLHAPRLGEHGREVLAEVGLSGDEVDGLIATGVLRLSVQRDRAVPPAVPSIGA